MKYTIPHINDSRTEYTYAIRCILKHWEEIDIPAVNGNYRENIESEIARRGVEVTYNGKLGQIGRWFTFLNHLDSIDDEMLFVVEDDGVLHPDFVEKSGRLLPNVPSDADFFSLFIPRNRTVDVYDYFGNSDNRKIKPIYDVGHHLVCRAHQPYGGVAMFLYPGFREKIYKFLIEKGICGQFDDIIYGLSQKGVINGYSVVPDMEDLAWIIPNIPSTVHETGYYFD